MTDLLAREAASLVGRLRTWTPSRFAAAVGPPPAATGDALTRGDVVHHLAQVFVDAAGEAPVPLPRLDDLVLPDQLAVAADDLLWAEPPETVAADLLAHLLLHRAELLGESLPNGLVAALGHDDEPALLLRARRLCPFGGGPLRM